MEQTTANGAVLTATKDSVNRSNGLPATTSAQPPPDCPSSCSELRADNGRASGVKSMYRNELPIRQFIRDVRSTARSTKCRATARRGTGTSGTNPAAMSSDAGHLSRSGASSYRATPAGSKASCRNGTADGGTRTPATGHQSAVARHPSPWRPVSASVEVRWPKTLARNAAEVKRVRRGDAEINSSRKRCPSVSALVQRRPTDRGASACTVRRTRSVPATSRTTARRHDNDNDLPPTTEPTRRSRGASWEKIQSVKMPPKKTDHPVRKSPCTVPSTKESTSPSRGGSPEKTQPVKRPSEKTHQPMKRSKSKVPRTPSSTEPTGHSRGASREKTQPLIRPSSCKRCPSVSAHVRCRPTDRTGDASACSVRRTRSAPATSTTLARRRDNDIPSTRTEPTRRSRGASRDKTQSAKTPSEKTRQSVTRSPVPRPLSTTALTGHGRGASPEKTQPVKMPSEKSRQPVRRFPSTVPSTREPTSRSRGGSPEKTQPVKIPPEKTNQPVRRLPSRVPSTTEPTSCSRDVSPEKTQTVKIPSSKTHQPAGGSPSRVPRSIPPAHSTSQIHAAQDNKPMSSYVTALQASLESAWNKVPKVPRSSTECLLLLAALFSIVIIVIGGCVYMYVNSTQVPPSPEKLLP